MTYVFHPVKTAAQIVEECRAIRWWIDRQIEKGRTDDDIMAELPLAVSVITGRTSLAALARIREGGTP